MAIEVINQQRLVKVNRRHLSELAEATVDAVEKIAGKRHASPQLSVVFVRDKKIQELNRLYKGNDYPTDVLSFPADAAHTDMHDFAYENYLGDIVISTDTALRQAGSANLSIEREIQELLIHGVLHLCGYDHETDNGEMNRLELKLRKKLLH